MPPEPEGAHFRRERTAELLIGSICIAGSKEHLSRYHREGALELMELWRFVVGGNRWGAVQEGIVMQKSSKVAARAAANANARSRTARKIATGVGLIALLLGAATATGFAKPPPGGHPAGGGHPPPGGGHPPGGHPGGAPHFAAPHIGGGPHVAAPHFSAAHVGGSHFAAPRAHVGAAHVGGTHLGGIAHHFATPHTSHVGSSAIHTHVDAAGRGSHIGHMTPSATTAHSLATGVHAAVASRAAFKSDPRAFAAHRHLAGDPAFRPFLGHGWHPYHHLGWIGPVFWPYAYGDLFYSALWPDDYDDVDPFWAYGYGDIYSAIFSPYLYDDYVQGPSAPERMASLTQSMAQSCADEAAEVTGWPVDQIQAAVQPTEQQTALLDALGNALVSASDEVKSHCPTTVSFTPTARLNDMHVRLQALVDAVNIVTPPLDKFYDSLSDEQKARFNAIQPPASQHAQAQQGQQSAPNLQAQCNATVMAWPTDKIDQVVQPNGAQREKLQGLQSAAAQAADMIKTACPTEQPATPPSRLAAIGKRLQAMLQAVETVQPALANFYSSLSDDQKARFDGMGRQLFAQNQQ
jgi:hypothetical protein